MQKLTISRENKATILALLIVGLLTVFGYFFHLMIIDWVYVNLGINVTRDIALLAYVLFGGVAYKVCSKKLDIGYR